jgi:hypothetical protein
MVGLPDFPHCALGTLVDIRGQAGVVIGIVNNSIKVKSSDGSIQSYNYHRLKTLYSPVVHAEPEPVKPPPVPRPAPAPAPVAESAPASKPWIEQIAKPTPPPPPAPKRDLVTEPDFSAPIKPITEFAGRVDFPQCILGQHVDIVGFKGVVVELVKQSIKVRSAEGVGRSYNAALLQKLYGKP